MPSLVSFARRFLQNGIDRGHPVRSLSRWPVWLSACALRTPRVVTFATGGLRMRLVPRLHSFGSTSIFIKRDFYEPELLAVGKLIGDGDVVLDVGASFGIFSLFMAHFAGPGGKVHAIEAGQFSFAQLKANVALNALQDRIILHRLAASDATGELRLAHCGGSPVNFTVGELDDTISEAVPAARLEDVIPAEDAARIGFIKIDVEGYEVAAFRGMESILRARTPHIMFEVSAAALARQKLVPADVYAYLAQFGYSFWHFENGRFAPTEMPVEGNIFASVADLRSSALA